MDTILKSNQDRSYLGCSLGARVDACVGTSVENKRRSKLLERRNKGGVRDVLVIVEESNGKTTNHIHHDYRRHHHHDFRHHHDHHQWTTKVFQTIFDP